ncbi:MAG: glycosyltransferase family 39 protein [Candidatus Sumerlaeia bacterium]|nr:glycosyltransferase family 39 protein [Candidatus Sumerlaeia bacterium]
MRRFLSLPMAWKAWLSALWADARKPSFYVFFLLFCVLLGFRLGVRPFNPEESRALAGMSFSAIKAAGNPPGHALICLMFFPFGRLIQALSLPPELLEGWLLRLTSVFFAVAAFPFWWAIARRFFGRNVGLVAFLLSTSAFIIFSARFFQHYALAMLETGAATWLLLKVLEKPSRRLWIAYGAVLLLSLYTFYSFIVVILAHITVFCLAWRREPRRLLLPAMVIAVVAIGFAPWTGILVRGMVGGQTDAETLSPANRVAGAAGQVGYTLYAFSVSDSFSPFALPYSALAAVFYAALTVLGLRRIWQNRTARSMVIPLTVGLAILVPAALRLAGWVTDPIPAVPTRLLFAAPFFVMIVACGLLEIANVRLRLMSLALAVIIQGVSLFNYYGIRQWTYWPYAAHTDVYVSDLHEQIQDADLVVFDTWNLIPPAQLDLPSLWQFGPKAPDWPAGIATARRVAVLRATHDRASGGRMEKLLNHLKLHFILQEHYGYVIEPPNILRWKKRLLRREICAYKIELLVFERVKADKNPETQRGNSRASE